MKPGAWRALILTLCAIAAFSAVTGVVAILGMGAAPPWTGRYDASFAPAGQFTAKVIVIADGPASKAGLRAGDRIDVRGSSLQDRYWVAYRPLNGNRVVFLLQRGALQKKVVVVPNALRERFLGAGKSWTDFLIHGTPFFVSPFLTLWLVLFASLIAWRRSHVPVMRLLALVLAVAAIGNEFSPDWAVPWPWLYGVADFCSDLVGPLAIALSVAFAGTFARPLSQVRRVVQWLCYTVAAVWFAQGAAASIGLITLWLDPYSPGIVSPVPAYVLAAFALSSCTLAIIASLGAERKRAAWTLVPLSILLYVPTLATPIHQTLFESSGFADDSYATLQGLVQFLAPVALTYAALSRRLIDIGFVLNRALVFTLVSTIVVGVFILVEWAASTWLTNATHITSAVIAMLVALGLGFSLGYIHKYVDRFVDRVFFRKRHEDEAALRRFAHEATYITDRTTLLDRAVHTVMAHTHVDEASILVQDGVAGYVSAVAGARVMVGENDPGIVALRAWHKPVELHLIPDSLLRSEVAFPMVSRGDLLGTLVCGPKCDGEAYAPDESEALFALAHGVGSALGILAAEADGTRGSVAKEIAELRALIEALPKAVAEQIRRSNGQ